MEKFRLLLSKLLNCFRGSNLLLHVLAIALSYGLVNSGFDWSYYTATQNPVLQAVLFPAIILGSLGTLLALIVLLLVGKLGRKPDVLKTAFALIQAFILALVVTSFYKALTGRAHPEALDFNNSTVFQFSLLRGGVFWGWPSGHTVTAFALAGTLYRLYPKSLFRCVAMLYAFYIGIGVSVSIHWFSDFVAGALIGTSIARAVIPSSDAVTTSKS